MADEREDVGADGRLGVVGREAEEAALEDGEPNFDRMDPGGMERVWTKWTWSPTRPWAALLAWTVRVDVLERHHRRGWPRLLAVVAKIEGVRRCLERLGEPAEPPVQAPARGGCRTGRAPCSVASQSTWPRPDEAGVRAD